MDRNKEWIGVFALLFIVIALGFSVYNLEFQRFASPAATGVQRRTRFGSFRLRADQSGKLWKVSWDPSNAPLKHAATAELLIDDGPERTAQSLSPAQIRKGYVLYSPHTNDVVFQLQVVDKDDNRMSSTVRLVRFGRDAQLRVVETCQEVSGPTKAQPRTVGNSPDTPSPSSPTGSAEHSQPVARPIILNNDEPATPKRMQSSTKSVETADSKGENGPMVRNSPVVLQLPPDPPASSLAPPGKLRRVFRIFPNTGRHIMRLFRIKKRKSASEIS